MFYMFTLSLLLIFGSPFIKKSKTNRLPPPCPEQITVCEPNGDGEVCYPIDPWPPCFE